MTKIMFITVCILFCISVICTIFDPSWINFSNNLICLACCYSCWISYKNIKHTNQEIKNLEICLKKK